MRDFLITTKPTSLTSLLTFLRDDKGATLTVSQDCLKTINKSHECLQLVLETETPLYGVNTGFGDSLFRFISNNHAEKLQQNLISYLICGVGKPFPKSVARAVMVTRLLSLTRGYSGVSQSLVEHLADLINRNWTPLIPQHGSLGASGDLIPLAYLGQLIQGKGMVETLEGTFKAEELFKKFGVTSYILKPKEGLAIVNGTSAMAGICLHNLQHVRFLTKLSLIASSWLCIALQGRTDAFGPLVNSEAKTHPGQHLAANFISSMFSQEDYRGHQLNEIKITNGQTVQLVQDRYSLRCSPQILGPIIESITQAETWIENEINGASDNPLFGTDGAIANGGNFYGGYLASAMDFLKIGLCHIADLMDRQLISLVDEKSNRGLPPNLANWPGIKESERPLHHGLKGLNQAVSALTSEIIAKGAPVSIYSRSAESHNQDKVSLGMSAALQCGEVIEALYNISALYLTCLAQALDLRGFSLRGKTSKPLFDRIRNRVAFIEHDQPTGDQLQLLIEDLKQLGNNQILTINQELIT
ncbi:MAG: aromatic amino acid lyase [Chlamydiae bacterium]|nr:aromatic amino acid lyase [Chlamydiota bacterium]